MTEVEEALCEVAELDADRNPQGVGYASNDGVTVIYTKDWEHTGRDRVEILHNG